MRKYHISKNGKPAICRVTVKPCPLGGDNEHFRSKEEAQKYADKKNAKENSILAGVGKTLKKQFVCSEFKKSTSPDIPKFDDYESKDDYWIAYKKAEIEWNKYEQQLDICSKELRKIIDKDIYSNRIYNNPKKFKEWCSKNGYSIDKKSLAKIDPMIWDNFVSVAEEMKERFPCIQYDRLAKTQQKFEQPITANSFTLKFDTSNDDEFFIQSNMQGFLFGRGADDYGGLLVNSLNSILSGYMVRGDGTIKTLLRHEFGHQVKDSLEFNKYGRLDKLIDRFDDITKDVNGRSKYSHINRDELFAEGFADWSSGGTSDFARIFGEIFEKIIKEG